MPKSVRVASVEDVPPGHSLVAEVGSHRVAIFNTGDELRAIADSCSHRGGPLSQGMFDASGVTCPWHGATFEFKDGQPDGFPTTEPVRCYELRIISKDVEVIVPDSEPSDSEPSAT